MAQIYVISPSSALRDRAKFKRGVARLKKLGHGVELDEAAVGHYQRFAGDDATRLACLGRAADSGADVVMISRGGYGLTRSLPDLPYKAIAKSVAKGCKWMGYSDFTALQAPLWAKTGAVTWMGPAVSDDFGLVDPDTDAPDDIMEACFDDLMQGVGEGTGWRMSAPLSFGATHKKAANNDQIALTSAKFSVKNAVFWGGNLNVLCSMVGTPYLPQVKGGILMLEDVGEHPYRVERQLTQLLHAGILGSQKAIILGQFTGYKLFKGYDRGFNIKSVTERLQSKLPKTPILDNMPFGHVPTKVCLPWGAQVQLDVQGRDALVFWGEV
jgi:muramoyltetrapeptide carboxypeptidase